MYIIDKTENIPLNQKLGHLICLLCYLFWRIFKKPAKYTILLIFVLFVLNIIHPIRRTQQAIHMLGDLSVKSVAAAQSINSDP